MTPSSQTQVVRTTRADLEWWWAKAPTLSWTFAKTMPQWPHEYVVLDRTEGMDVEDFHRAARVIQTYGEPSEFYGRPAMYLVSEDGQTRWWTDFTGLRPGSPSDRASLGGCWIINQATHLTQWGEQNAPSTHTQGDTYYDSLAVGYDAMYLSDEDAHENTLLRRLIIDHFGPTAPTVLDIGCGTGLLLDLRVTHPALYRGVDPSRAMLNELWRKHPKAMQILPMTATEYLASTPQSNGDDSTWPESADLVVAAFGTASYLAPNDIIRMHDLTDSLLVLMSYRPGYLPAYYSPAERARLSEQTEQQSRWLREQFAPEANAAHREIGNFDVWTVDRRWR